MARLQEEEAWCEPQEELTAQNFEDEVYRLTTRMFECFDYIRDRLNMLDEKVHEIEFRQETFCKHGIRVQTTKGRLHSGDLLMWYTADEIDVSTATIFCSVSLEVSW